MDVILQLNKLYRKLWIKFGLIWSCTLQKGVTLHLHKVESSSPTDALYHVCSDLRLCRRRFENLVDACVFLLYCIVVLPLRRKECGFPFKQNKVLFASECYNMRGWNSPSCFWKDSLCDKFIFTSPKKIASPFL